MDGLILAGGKSTRMGGKHKGDLRYHDDSFTQILIKEFAKDAEHIWLSYGRDCHKTYENCDIVTDIYLDCGPIGGLHAGLLACSSDLLMVAACDMPFLKIELFRELLKTMKTREYLEGQKGLYDGVIPEISGRIHPLAGIYRRRTADIFESQIKIGNYCLRASLDQMNLLYVDITGNPEYERMLQNINTEEQYRELCGKEG